MQYIIKELSKPIEESDGVLMFFEVERPAPDGGQNYHCGYFETGEEAEAYIQEQTQRS